MIKLSIVIPIYNVEKYLSKCIESCLNQDFPRDEYEIICVNDGSTDKSKAIAEEFVESHSNVRLINQRNKGLSAARNTGLKEAKGEYIWFVDSDDRIETNCFVDLIQRANEENLDVLCFCLNLEYPDGKVAKYIVVHEDSGKVYDGKDFINRVDMPPAAWSAIYRKTFLLMNNLRFYEGILHEDQEFTPRAYCLATKIGYIDIPLYYYNQREGSIMKSNRNIKRCQDLLKVADSLYAFTIQNLEEGTAAYNIMMRKVYFCLSQSLAFYTKEAMSLKEYKSKPYFPIKLALLSGSMKRKAMLINFSLRLYLMTYKVFQFLRR